MDSITPYLPLHQGLLPKWLLFIGVVSIGNSIQSYATLYYTKRIYNADPKRAPSTSKAPAAAYNDISQSTVTPLSARTFGTWTFLTSIVRIYAAYNIDHPAFYQLALWTFVIAGCHFMSEWLIFKTAKWALALSFPVFVANISLVWMLSQWEYYVK